ncbi:hypothetical protein [Nonomuraea sp. NPDC052265]|uniref:hypothetical protein n=1 Tax=Nonomuraea sp. NPDC052265 TaxID=3364374 RepID=UPI0037CBDF6C
MSTLIAFYNSEGLVGRCDAKCYQAHESGCHCICAGSNHGVGLYRALANMQTYVESWVDLAHRRGWRVHLIEFADAVVQPEPSEVPLPAVGHCLIARHEDIPAATNDGRPYRRGTPA